MFSSSTIIQYFVVWDEWVCVCVCVCLCVRATSSVAQAMHMKDSSNVHHQYTYCASEHQCVDNPIHTCSRKHTAHTHSKQRPVRGPKSALMSPDGFCLPVMIGRHTNSGTWTDLKLTYHREGGQGLKLHHRLYLAIGFSASRWERWGGDWDFWGGLTRWLCHYGPLLPFNNSWVPRAGDAKSTSVTEGGSVCARAWKSEMATVSMLTAISDREPF